MNKKEPMVAISPKIRQDQKEWIDKQPISQNELIRRAIDVFKSQSNNINNNFSSLSA